MEKTPKAQQYHFSFHQKFFLMWRIPKLLNVKTVQVDCHIRFHSALRHIKIELLHILRHTIAGISWHFSSHIISITDILNLEYLHTIKETKVIDNRVYLMGTVKYQTRLMQSNGHNMYHYVIRGPRVGNLFVNASVFKSGACHLKCIEGCHHS